MLGDLIGQPGCRALFISLSKIIKENNIDFVVVNGENAADGFGITPEIAEQLFSLGVDVITTGNHIWQKDTIIEYMQRNDRLLRPANYPKQAPGNGFVIVEKKGIKYGVLNLIGRMNLVRTDCPFSSAKKIIQENSKKCNLFLIDMHAEAPEEKEALAYMLDGKASIVVGTHTHVQTADERILPKGTGYITDLGMTGPIDSVIGSEPELSITRVTTMVPVRMVVVNNDSMINGIIATIDSETGNCMAIDRLSERV